MHTDSANMPLTEPTEVRPRVALLMSNLENLHHLSTLLSDAGIEVLLEAVPSEDFLQRLQRSGANILLVDIPGDSVQDLHIIDSLLEQDSLPVLFHDSSSNGGIEQKAWLIKLVRKLQALVHSDRTPELQLPTAGQASVLTEPQAANTTAAQPLPPRLTDTGDFPARNVWVLGASLGGPQAVRQFLANIHGDLPVAFLLAQHIGIAHMAALADQLNSITSFSVYPAQQGHPLRHHDVVLIPADKQITISKDGYLKLHASRPGALFAPDIDTVLTTVLAHYGNKTGVIFFSGMGTDGVKTSKRVAEAGGQVWAQDAASCVVSSLPDHVRKTGCVSFSGSPEELAAQLNAFYQC